MESSEAEEVLLIVSLVVIKKAEGFFSFGVLLTPTAGSAHFPTNLNCW